MRLIKNKIFIIVLCLIIIISLILFIIFVKNKKNDNKADNVNSSKDGIEENIIDEDVIFANKEVNLEKKFDTDTEGSNLTTEQIESYWENYKNPDHWSEKTNNYTLAYVLDQDKKVGNALEENSNKIIENELPIKQNGVFIPKDSRKQLETFFKNNVDDKFYIDEKGFLNYAKNSNSLEISSDLTNLVNKLILDSNKLYILSVGYSYYAEENVIEDAATAIPEEFNYLRFKPRESIELVIYSQYNFSLDSFTEGIENLTGEAIKTK